MTVLDLINKSAIMLNIPEVLNGQIENLTAENEQEILSGNFALNRLYQFGKIVLNEVNLHMPQIAEAEVRSVDKKIPLEGIENLMKIVGIKNQYGYVKYSIRDNVITLNEDGEYTIIYAKALNISSVLDNVEIDSLGEQIALCGLNAYYCLATGLFAEFNIYNSQYADKLSKLKNLKVFAMPCRSWQ